MFKLARILTGGLLLAAGCATQPRQMSQETRPSDWGSPDDRVSQPEPPPEAPAPAPVTPPAPPVSALQPAERVWISLNRWGAEQGLGEPQRLSAAPLMTFGLTAPGGVLMLQVGSLSAFWNRLEFRLGFPPQLIGGQLFLHVLDVQKNLEPLLRGLATLPATNRIVVIDPGHGGASPGTRSAFDGRWEKEFTLDWALRLAPLLRQRGWEVFLTRTNDVEVPLPDRVACADSCQAGLFLSLHFNSSGGGREQAGLETYCLTPAGMASSLTRGYTDDAGEIMPNNAFDAENLQYAVRLHRSLLEIGGIQDRGVRRARFLGVLRGQNRPAVLVEGGYLSNPAEARRIADPAYRQKLAEAIARALE